MHAGDVTRFQSIKNRKIMNMDKSERPQIIKEAKKKNATRKFK
jgi:hypothetical protein